MRNFRSKETQVTQMTTLNDLFQAVDTIGSKYQTEAEKKAFDAEMEAIRKEIIRDAVLRGEYDQEKGIWLV